MVVEAGALPSQILKAEYVGAEGSLIETPRPPPVRPSDGLSPAAVPLSEIHARHTRARVRARARTAHIREGGRERFRDPDSNISVPPM